VVLAVGTRLPTTCRCRHAGADDVSIGFGGRGCGARVRHRPICGGRASRRSIRPTQSLDGDEIAIVSYIHRDHWRTPRCQILTHDDTTDGRTLESALVIGGTGFVGRHTVAELLAHVYEVTTMSRREQQEPRLEDASVEHVVGDRSDPDALRDVARETAPDPVVDCAAFHPGDVRMATDRFADVGAYVYLSSGGVYDAHEIPNREDETPLHDCTPEQAAADSMASYGPRKAECDRETATAADRGVTAMRVRPTMVYGPKTVPSADGSPSAPRDPAPSWAEDVPGIQGHHDYWIDRLRRFDRVIVPGDGTAIWHRAYVEDVARAIRVVAERGASGEAYNVADRRVCTMEDVIDLIAGALDTSVTVVHASERELARVGLDPDDFVLYHHLGSRYPHVLDTCKLASLGWQSTPVERSIARTVEECVASGRDGSAFDPERDAEERLLAALDG
jgi:nucleoside-diphosphate-sugar epimerase